MRTAIALLLLAIFLIFPVNAVEKVRYERTTFVKFDVTQIGSEYTIVSIYLNDIANFDSVQTLILDSYGETYYLTIKSSTSGLNGAYKTFNVTLIYPTGQTISKEVTVLNPFARDYDVRIQYWVYQYDTPITGMDIDILTSGLLDFDVLVVEGLEGMSTKFNLSKFVVFNRVEASSTAEMNAEIFYLTKTEWINEVKESTGVFYTFPVDYSGVQGAIWSTFLNLVSQIPVVGENLADALNFMAIIVGETFYFAKLILVENWELTVLTYESFAMMYAMQSRNLVTMYRRFVRFHIQTAEFIYGIIYRTLQLIYSLIQAVGSLLPFT